VAARSKGSAQPGKIICWHPRLTTVDISANMA